MSVSPVLEALSEASGPVLVLDAQHRIVAASTEVETLLGHSPPTGSRAVDILCGAGDSRPIAEALAEGRAAVGTVIRPRGPGDHVAVRVRARPLPRSSGWLLQLSEDAPEIAADGAMDFCGIRTADAGMKRLLHVVRRAAATDVTVLVRGETGTGKELLAHAIHELSSRSRGPFRAINCAALSPTLLESELFGHVRGAFTGAMRDSPGHFRNASGGTLLLDEVAEMPADLQAKLLRVIETGTVTPVGATDAIAVDVRIVAATHKSLRAEVSDGRFRADLMYRLRKVPLFLPPLRRRTGDIELLTRHFIEELNRRGGRQVERTTTSVMEVLTGYGWPGNVRELTNALEYAYVVGDGPILVVSDLPPEIVDSAQAPDALLATPVNAPPAPGTSTERLSEADRIGRALERSGGHRGRAAQALGWSRVTLWRKMKQLGMVES